MPLKYYVPYEELSKKDTSKPIKKIRKSKKQASDIVADICKIIIKTEDFEDKEYIKNELLKKDPEYAYNFYYIHQFNYLFKLALNKVNEIIQNEEKMKKEIIRQICRIMIEHNCDNIDWIKNKILEINPKYANNYYFIHSFSALCQQAMDKIFQLIVT